MKKMSKLAASVGLGGALLLSGMSAADAARSYPGGGIWDQGRSIWTNTVYSDYYHAGVAHGSTACNKNKCKRSETVPRGKWSRASITGTLGGNQTYWRK